MQTRADSELVVSGLKGDTQALSELFERHYASSVRVARRILRSDEEARDAVQSAYLAAFEHFRGFRREAQFRTWITRIVKNQCFMNLRRPERRRPCSNLEDRDVRDAVMAHASQTPTPEDLARAREVDMVLCDAASKLPARLKGVYMLCCISGLGVREAADTLGLTVPAAKTRLFRAQHRIRAEVGRRFAVRSQDKIVLPAAPRETLTSTPLAA